MGGRERPPWLVVYAGTLYGMRKEDTHGDGFLSLTHLPFFFVFYSSTAPG